jgi:hypothetical protein
MKNYFQQHGAICHALKQAVEQATSSFISNEILPLQSLDMFPAGPLPAGCAEAWVLCNKPRTGVDMRGKGATLRAYLLSVPPLMLDAPSANMECRVGLCLRAEGNELQRFL